MEKIKNDEGAKMLPLIWTVFLSQSPDLWAEPFSGRQRRHRCIFIKNNLTASLTACFHLSDDEFPFLVPGPIYFYGAFNQVSVCQVRSYGNLKNMTMEEILAFKELIKERVNGGLKLDKLPLLASPRDLDEAQLLVQSSGRFYCFEPLEYAFNNYERG